MVLFALALGLRFPLSTILKLVSLSILSLSRALLSPLGKSCHQ